MRKTTLLFASLLFAVTTARANHYADTYVIPAVGHVQGANGAVWMSDLTIRNFGSAPLHVSLIVIESGFETADNVYPLMSDASPDGTLTVNPGSTVQLRDIMRGHRGMTNNLGALIVGGDQPFAVTSRAYSNTMQLGQTVPASRDFLDSSVGTADNTATAYIPGIVSNAAARTNVGFVAGSAGSTSEMTIEVTLRNGTGGVVGTRSITIPAGRFAHMQFPVASFAQGAIDVGSADFRITQGEGVVVPYASVIDNRTGEASYLMGVFPPSGPPSATTLFRALAVGAAVR
ncbi:MAG TPA: hypothetical protein VND45_01220 [Thermoanaerobaculia bacterium]|jgi:hypothetical protein|nr:hypothetical protein [Thermoanaerobaculia bacterium]